MKAENLVVNVQVKGIQDALRQARELTRELHMIFLQPRSWRVPFVLTDIERAANRLRYGRPW